MAIKKSMLKTNKTNDYILLLLVIQMFAVGSKYWNYLRGGRLIKKPHFKDIHRYIQAEYNFVKIAGNTKKIYMKRKFTNAV